MSREIDPEKGYDEYTDDELQYALDRDWFETEEEAQKVKEYLDAKRGDEDNLHTMKVADLRQVAEDEGIDLGDAKKKEDIIAAIEAAREEATV